MVMERHCGQKQHSSLLPAHIPRVHTYQPPPTGAIIEEQGKPHLTFSTMDHHPQQHSKFKPAANPRKRGTGRRSRAYQTCLSSSLKESHTWRWKNPGLVKWQKMEMEMVLHF